MHRQQGADTTGPPKIEWDRRDRRGAGLVALGAAVLALPFLAGISMLDEGTLVHIADRIASGEVLYRDVATGVMPGSYYLHALLFLVFGRTLLVGRVLMILLFAAASTGVFLIARSVTSRSMAFASAASFAALTVHHWRFPGYSPQAICLVLLTLAAAQVFLTTRERKWLLLTGLALGLTILFKQNYGTFAALGVAAGLMVGANDFGRGVRDVTVAALVAALPLAITAGLFTAAGAGAEFWYFTVGVPLQAPSTVFARPWPPFWGEPDARLLRDLIYYLPFEQLAAQGRGWLDAHRWLSMAIVRVTYYLPLLFLLAASLAWKRKRSRLRQTLEPSRKAALHVSVGALYLGTSAFLFLGVFPRVDTHHLFMVLAPSFLLAAWLVGRKPRKAMRRSAWVVVSVLMAICVMSRIAAIAHTEPELVQDTYFGHPRARIWAGHREVVEIQRQLDEIDRRVPEGEPIFVAPSAPMYYFLTNRPNPTRYPLILPGALDEEDVVRTLERAPVRYALISDIAFESFPFEFVAPIVWDYLLHDFRPAEDAGWNVAPHAPYLYSRAVAGEPTGAAFVDWLVDTGDASPPVHGGVRSAVMDAANWTEARSLMPPAMGPAPVYQIVAIDDWPRGDRRLVDWLPTYLESSLVVQAPGGWSKLLVSWEVPTGRTDGSEFSDRTAHDHSGPGLSFEFACALTPSAWAGLAEGQGALVEVWVSSAGTIGGAGHVARRVWRRWLNPADVPADRRWHRALVDLSSFVDASRAVVTLVVGAAPTFVTAGSTVAWSDLRLVARADEVSGAAEVPLFEPRNIRIGEAAVRRMLYFSEADLPLFEDAASRYSDLADAHSALADVAASLGREDLALRASQEAVRRAPEQSLYWIQLGQRLLRAGQVSEALDAIDTAIEIDPETSSYHAALADALLNVSDGADRARSACLEALRLDSTNTWAWTLLSAAERRMGAAEAAVRAAERSVELEPYQAWPRLALAESLQSMGRTQEALHALEQAALLNMDTGARAALARNLLQCGRPQRAREEALVALEQDPESAVGWTVLAHVESTLEEWEPAVAAWREVVERDSENSSAFVQLARALAKVSRSEEAYETLAAAQTLAGDGPARLRETALVFDELGWPDEATAIWRRVETLAGDDALRSEAQRRLSAVSTRRGRDVQ